MEAVTRDTPCPYVARLTLNRPERRNAVDRELRHALIDGVAAALEDPEVRVLVLTGSGGAFSAGGDVASMTGLDTASGRARMRDGQRLVRLLASAEKPLIAAVDGWAVGAGAGLALLCDTVVAGRSAKFGFSFFRIGLVPDYALALTLAQRVGAGRARQWLLYARTVTAEQGLAVGLVDELVEDDAVAATALERARELAVQPPHALALAKRLLAQMPVPLEVALEMELMAQTLCFLSPEAAEGRAAFLEKRPPRF
ncbi:MAG TPA: enoyl-CoA hydratase-related protein [Azospirillum sp.]|nr:enoyl-CoA hydratase-related protein [Azospirillum sp.]